MQHVRDLARRPGDRAVGTERDLIDPALLVVGGEHAMLAVGVGRDELAVVAAGDDALAVRGAGEDAAAVDRRRGARHSPAKQQRLLAEHEDRRRAEKMHADDRRARVNGADAVGERRNCGACVSLTLRDAAFEALADFFFRQIAADEDDAAVARSRPRCHGR